MARSKGTWGTVREVPRKGSGRFQASYVHGGVRGIQPGTRYTAPQTFDTRGDAWAWLDRERRLIDKDDWTPPRERLRAAEVELEQLREARRLAGQVPTIAEYGARYCDRDNLAPTTRDRYRMLLRLYIKAEPSPITRRGATMGKSIVKVGLGDVRVTELTRAHVRQWWQGLPVKTREASSRQAYDLLRAIMNEALDDELVDVNPVRLKDASRAQAGRERDLDPLPIDTLYAVADAMPDRYRLGVLLGGVLALRSGEIRGLQRRDFHLADGVATVKVERSIKEAGGEVILGPLKTARRGIATRTLPIPAALVQDVKAHLRDHTQLGRTGLLFWRPKDGGPVRNSDWLRVFKRACRKVADRMERDAELRRLQTGEPESDESLRIRELLTGNGGYIFHGTRVTALTWAYRLSGGNLRAVQAIAGHTSPKMALRYQRAEMDYLAAIADNVSEMIKRDATTWH
ncbi:MAG TPA: site-specific integrase [Propionibacteriaceae bacterium]|nr:site-specific integrase [Propionibacteriaceae bacterium]